MNKMPHTSHKPQYADDIAWEVRLGSADDHAQPDTREACTIRPARPTTQDHGKRLGGRAKSVLIVDGKSNNRLLLKRLVTAMGHIPLVAANGAQGIAMARSLSPDLILIDTNMPEMDGEAALKEIRALDRESMILAFTVSDSDTDNRRLMRIGFDGYLRKPVNAQDLRAVLSAV